MNAALSLRFFSIGEDLFFFWQSRPRTIDHFPEGLIHR
jgi:hypothetical protein